MKSRAPLNGAWTVGRKVSRKNWFQVKTSVGRIRLSVTVATPRWFSSSSHGKRNACQHLRISAVQLVPQQTTGQNLNTHASCAKPINIQPKQEYVTLRTLGGSASWLSFQFQRICIFKMAEKVISSTRKRKVRLTYNEFTYTKDKNGAANVIYWRCQHRNDCRGRCKTVVGEITSASKHSHEQTPAAQQLRHN